jgi:hypothetical protein
LDALAGVTAEAITDLIWPPVRRTTGETTKTLLAGLGPCRRVVMGKGRGRVGASRGGNRPGTAVLKYNKGRKMMVLRPFD